jgi:translocation and assembly module TamA
MSVARALTLAFAALASGCAMLRQEPAAPPPPPPAVRLAVDAPNDDLKKLLETHLVLGRLNVLAPGEPIAETELARLVAATPAQARELLETEGYFNAEVTVERPSDEPDLVRVHVVPGPRVRVEDVRIEVRGPIVERLALGDPQAQAAQRDMRRNWSLPTGAPFRNADWVSAKNGALARLRAQGYLGASWARTTAHIDAETHHARLEVVAESGPPFRIGELRVRGLARQDEKVVRNLAGFGPGTPASDQLFIDYQERLLKSGLFDRATVVVEDDVAKAEAARVTVRVSEQKLNQATVGVGISADVGPRVSVEHWNRKFLDWNATLYNKLEYAKLRQAWEGELSSHAGPRFWRNLFGWTYERQESDTDVVNSLRLRLGRTKETRPVDRLYFVEIESGLRKTGQTREETDAVSLNDQIIWRRVDNVILPTDGYTVSLQAGGGYARSNIADSGPFARLWTRLIGYKPLGAGWFGMARVELGQVFVRDNIVVPDSQRFRAGGQDSVRGYEYRSLGPLDSTGAVASGNVVFTTSLEAARPILARLPSLWGAVFIDAGRAANRWADLDPALGVGVGLRLRSPIGPLRVDVSWGEEVHKARIDLSIGVLF